MAKITRNSLADKIKFVRPTDVQGRRIFYNREHHYDPERYDMFLRWNALIQIRLYKYFCTRPVDQCVEKDYLTHLIGFDSPSITKAKIGRTLNLITEYPMHMQKNPSRKAPHGEPIRYFWRWGHPDEPIYGMEYLILTWFPRWLKWTSGEVLMASQQYEDELEIIRNQSSEEDHEMIKIGDENRVWSGF